MKSAIKIVFVGVITIAFLTGCRNKAEQNTPHEQVTINDSLVYDTAPRWSVTGDKILFYTYRHDPEGAELYSITPDKSKLVRLTNTHHNEWWSDYAPTANTIYTSSDYGRSERFAGGEIFALDAKGTMTQITHSSDSASFNIYPRVSANGSQLLYCSNCIGKDVNSEIVLVQADGANPVNLTEHPAADRYGTWSPDGSRVLFESNRTGSFQLYILNLNTKELIQVTDNVHNNIQGDWSINNKIVFVSDRDGDDELYVMNADGTDQTQLTFNEVRDVQPSWSPDGKRIAYATYRFGKKDKADIFLIDTDGKNDTRLTDK